MDKCNIKIAGSKIFVKGYICVKIQFCIKYCGAAEISRPTYRILLDDVSVVLSTVATITVEAELVRAEMFKVAHYQQLHLLADY